MFQRIALSVLVLLAFLSIFSSCEKDPEVITKTVVEKDTIIVTETDTVFLTLTDTISLTEFIHDTATTFILIRHAETTGGGSDPGLSAEGQERTEELVRVLKNVTLDGVVYSTNFNRTEQTAQPVATDKGMAIGYYNPSALGGFADALLQTHFGKTILVVGHSNTTPDLLNILTGNNYPDIPETQFDNFFVATVFEKGRASVAHLKYGKPTP